MCYTCWDEYGNPKTKNDKVNEAIELINEVYEHSAVGGNLHIVLDDWNIEAGSIDWCIEEAIPKNVHEAPPEALAIETKLARLLRSIPLKHRASALAHANNYI